MKCLFVIILLRCFIGWQFTGVEHSPVVHFNLKKPIQLHLANKALQSYFERMYPHANVCAEDTLQGPVYIRFELGAELENGTDERVQQAADRAFVLFNDTFDNLQNEVWMLIYEYPEPNSFNAANSFLHQQLPMHEFETLDCPDVENGLSIITGKLPVGEIQAKNILRAIANTEMGFEPGMDQTIFFFDPINDRAFHMYDDRGCIIWSDRADKLRAIYIKRCDWIVDYHRSEIKNFFDY